MCPNSDPKRPCKKEAEGHLSHKREGQVRTEEIGWGSHKPHMAGPTKSWKSEGTVSARRLNPQREHSLSAPWLGFWPPEPTVRGHISVVLNHKICVTFFSRNRKLTNIPRIGKDLRGKNTQALSHTGCGDTGEKSMVDCGQCVKHKVARWEQPWAGLWRAQNVSVKVWLGHLFMVNEGEFLKGLSHLHLKCNFIYLFF